MDTLPTYRNTLRTYNSNHLLRTLFLLLVMLLSYNTWASSQDVVIGHEYIEVVDSLEETDENKECELEVQQDDDFYHPLSYCYLEGSDINSTTYASPPLSLNYRTIPLLPPEQ